MRSHDGIQTGTKVLVVGGRSGLGRVIAEYLRDKGALVVAASRRAHSELPTFSDIAEADVDATDVAAVAECIRILAPDHVVATCADVIRKPIASLTQSECRGSFETKFWGQFNIGRAAIENLPAHGSLVLFSGIASQIWFPNLGLAGVINAAIEKLTLELAASGPIRVNCVSPGIVDVPHGIGGHERSTEFMAAHKRALPSGNAVTADQVAAMVHHFITNQGANGMIAKLDAGHHAICGSPA